MRMAAGGSDRQMKIPTGGILVFVGVFLAGACTPADQEIPEEAEQPPEQVAEVAASDSASFTTIRGDTGVVRLVSPRPDEVVQSPLVIRGEARGSWFFEASFPITLTNWDGLIIADGIATAQGEWMTEDYVPFEGILEFEQPNDIGDFSRRGALILQKDNPSGLPEHSDALEITIFFWDEG